MAQSNLRLRGSTCIRVKTTQVILSPNISHPPKEKNLSAYPELDAYYQTGEPLVCELEVSPYWCEFWPKDELDEYNRSYEVAEYAPDHFGFATSGGGEMFAFSPSRAIVVLPFIGMESDQAKEIAPSWQQFKQLLRRFHGS